MAKFIKGENLPGILYQPAELSGLPLGFTMDANQRDTKTNRMDNVTVAK